MVRTLLLTDLAWTRPNQRLTSLDGVVTSRGKLRLKDHLVRLRTPA